MSELARRIIFAVIAAPLGILVIYLGGAVLAAVAAALAALAAWEYCRIARAAGADPLDAIAVVCAAAVPLVAHAAQLRLVTPSATDAIVLLLVVAGVVVFVRPPGRRPIFAASATVFAIAYASLITFLYLLRYNDYVVDARGGTALAMLPVLLTWATDVGAYTFGRAFGERKLLPSVSPGKTIAGAVGGLLFTMVISLLYVMFVLRPLAQLAMLPVVALVFGGVVSAVAQIGDLFESAMKRDAGVKDSGTLLPGHGGILDRFDSLLFVLPVAALLLHAFLIAAPA